MNPAIKPSSSSIPQGIRHQAMLYLSVCKINVIVLMLVTALVGAYLATNLNPNLLTLLLALLGIGLCAASGAAFNHGIDHQRDKLMVRTHNRPLAQQQLSLTQVYGFACLLLVSGFSLLWWWVNPLCAVLSLLSMVGYALIYSHWLKALTPQNITIGGLAGAMPPLLGWVAMSGEMHAFGWLLVLIIFTWTPPHFWALAYYRQKEYAKADVPMLSVTHGCHYTSVQLLLYTLLLSLVTLLPYLSHFSHGIYLITALLLNSYFLWLALKLLRHQSNEVAKYTFRYSIVYLLVLFIALLVDQAFPI